MTSILLNTLFLRKFQSSQLISHHFTLEQIIQAYDTFDDAMKVEALKVIAANDIMMKNFTLPDGAKPIPFPVV